MLFVNYIIKKKIYGRTEYNNDFATYVIVQGEKDLENFFPDSFEILVPPLYVGLNSPAES